MAIFSIERSQIGPRRLSLSRLTAWIFGFDYFISYPWSDGKCYATTLAYHLRKQGFECFLDSDDVAKGDNWRVIVNFALRRTSRLLVICSPSVVDSKAVAREVDVFLRTRRRIIPIDFGTTLKNASRNIRLRQLIDESVVSICENVAAITNGPSENVIVDLKDSFDLVRKAKRRERILAATVLIFFLLAAASLVGFWSAETRLKESLSRGLAARSEIESARQMDLALLLAAEANRIRSTTSSRSGLLNVIERAPVKQYLHGEAAVGVVAVSPNDPEFMVSGHWNGTLTAWNLATGEILASVSATEKREATAFKPAISFSADGTRLASNGDDDKVLLWKVSETGLELHRVLSIGLGRTVREIMYLDNRRILVAMKSDGSTLTLVDLETGDHEDLPDAHRETPSAIVVDDFGRKVVTAGSDHRIVLWNLTSSSLQRRTTYDAGEWVLDVDFDPSSTYLIAGLERTGVLLLDTETGNNKKIDRLGGGRVFAVAFASQHDGSLGFVWAGDDGVGDYQFEDAKVRRWPIHLDAVLDLAWEPGQRLVVTAGRDGKVAVLDLRRHAAISTHVATFDPSHEITASVLRPGKRYQLLGDETGKLHVFDLDAGKLLGSVDAHDGRILDIVYCEETSLAVSVGDDDAIRWWTLDGTVLSTWGSAIPSVGTIDHLAIAPRLRAVIALVNDGTVWRVTQSKLHNRNNGQLFLMDSNQPRVFAAHPTEPWIVASKGSEMIAFDWKRGTEKWRVELDEFVRATEIDVEGGTILVARGLSIELRSAHNGEVKARFPTGRIPVQVLRVAGASGLVAAIHFDSSLTLWDLEDQTQIGSKLPAHEVIQAGFGGRGSALLTLEKVDGINRYLFRRWVTDHVTWERMARQVANRTLSEVEMRSFDVRR
ncbi:MAG: TIR domain-containing protein [Spirochaetaceae bacterium]|nr:TIR domain-containing protein [Spirochaetaceae bacterium]